MDKRFTDEDIINVAKCCRVGNCKSCPLENDEKCATNFLNCIIEYMENKPATMATDTSSEASVKEDANLIHTNDSIKEQIYQAYGTVDEACGDIIEIYEVMSERERRAFALGGAYGKIYTTRDMLRKLKGSDSNDG